jgi:hypothetical protein
MDFLIESDSNGDAYYKKLRWVLIPAALMLLGAGLGYFIWHNSTVGMLFPVALVFVLLGSAMIRKRQFRASLRLGILCFEYTTTMRNRTYGARYDPVAHRMEMPVLQFYGYRWRKSILGNDLYVIRQVNGELQKSHAIPMSGLSRLQRQELVDQLETILQRNKRTAQR